MITIQNVSHQINQQTILNNVSLDLPQGGITALIGANGAGKSTLLSFMARLRPLVSGSIAYNGRDLASTPTAEDQAIVDNALVEFQLQELSHRYLTELSGGQRQRALIAMVFCQSTEYVLLDEPLNNLDMYYARNLMQLLRRLAHSQQRTIIVVLHDINMAAAYADHVVAMKQGQVLFAGSPDEVFTVPNIQAAFNMTVDVMDYKGKKLIVHHC